MEISQYIRAALKLKVLAGFNVAHGLEDIS